MFLPLETIIHKTPLGIRCRDAATLAPVTDGLRITATPLIGSVKTRVAFMSRSGAFAFEGLPGLRDQEYPVGEEAVASPPAGVKFAIQAEDTLGRFLSWGMELTLPRDEVIQALLFSAPARPAATGLATIRGSLIEDGGAPAGHARISAQFSGVEMGAALADARGQFVMFLPWPDPLRPPIGVPVTSPNTAGRQTLDSMEWPVTLSFFYQPSTQKFICARPDGQIEIIVGQTSPPDWRCAPDLKSLMEQQAASVFPSTGGPPAPDMQVMIRFGQETIARPSAPSGVIASSLRLLPAP